MSTFMVAKKLNKTEAKIAYRGITKWFKANPTRKVCRTEVFDVRRKFIKEDILKHTVDGAKL